MKLAMTLPIKNHEYLIRQNILYHAAHGVDCFVVMLHNSEDGSENILKDLSRDIDILFFNFRNLKPYSFTLESTSYIIPK